jgi:hypothetical protein
VNRADRRAWRSARTWNALGALTVAWLRGELEQTPGHLGPPDPETIPLIPALTAANMAGFITTNSQRGDSDDSHAWEAWVCGLIPEHLFPALERALARTELDLRVCHFGPRRWRVLWHRRLHDHRPGFGCAWRADTGHYAGRCPALANVIGEAWGVMISDPVAGRNDVLWPALERFARA